MSTEAVRSVECTVVATAVLKLESSSTTSFLAISEPSQSPILSQFQPILKLPNPLGRNAVSTLNTVVIFEKIGSTESIFSVSSTQSKSSSALPSVRQSLTLSQGP